MAAPAFLRIPRLGAEPEAIEVDGRALGYTPRVVEVRAGARRVVLRDANGAVVLDRTVRAEARHTRFAPLVVGR